MSLFDKKEVKYTLGALSLGTLLFGLFKFYKYMFQHTSPPSILTSDYDNLSE